VPAGLLSFVATLPDIAVFFVVDAVSFTGVGSVTVITNNSVGQLLV
jgi:hypothetical protein